MYYVTEWAQRRRLIARMAPLLAATTGQPDTLLESGGDRSPPGVVADLPHD
jgi:hypothetical protein